MTPTRKQFTLGEFNEKAFSGDLLLFRANSLVYRFIGGYGRSPYSPAGMAVATWHVWMIAEMREFRGGRLVTLESQVRKYPGRIDWFSIDLDHFKEFRWWDAAACAIRSAGQEYNYRGVLVAGLRHLPFVRLCVSSESGNGAGYDVTQPRFCSEAVACGHRFVCRATWPSPNQSRMPS